MDPADYRIGIICALSVEMAAVHAMLDEEYPKQTQTDRDHNDYTFGRIGVHDVVIACLPAGIMGIAPAATVAKDMCRSFPIAFGLMVGVGGGVWSKKTDVRLGDVVVGGPEGPYGGVVQWDSGKAEKGGMFVRTGAMHKPPPVLLNAVQGLRAQHWKIKRGERKLDSFLCGLFADKPDMGETFGFQGVENDILVEADYEHGGGHTCDQCDATRIVDRTPMPTDPTAPRIHYGVIASGSQVVKHGITRDKIIESLGGAICFEMEAAGLDDFPCLVVRGICDYADSHKNKRWQPYAAVTAAAFAKELLGLVNKLERAKPERPDHPKHFIVPRRNPNHVAREDVSREMTKFLKRQSIGQVRISVCGLGGMGKTQIALDFAHKSRNNYHVFWVHTSTANNFLADFASIGRAVGVVGDHTQAPEACAAVQRWLDSEESGNWRMILDNLDDMSDDLGKVLATALPRHRGLIFITSRNEHIVGRIVSEGFCVRLNEMSISEAKQAFQKLSGISDTNRESDATNQLLEQLGYLPLAVAQAAAYIRRQRISTGSNSKHRKAI
ncbi:purine and uridine phosphorylase [Aspergillus ellipticus CBS 707.79]|uniref:Purine and uridine phosphorylase n=1 Tax=Aspergillus ellipticus CBS 707.79 TaxID=1448320 RepID=A0A319DLZ4_9EURO|nr:purine and uridine phosphorylase [Aspergillus ellipticus CBS 707.79]